MTSAILDKEQFMVVVSCFFIILLESAATRQIKADSGKNISYAPSKGMAGVAKTNIDVISIIAQAFSGNDAACAAVARIRENDSSILDWETKCEK